MVEYSELRAGRKLGRYELLVPLAQGATADVWAARMTGALFEKIVAVKVMSTDLCGPADVETDTESMFLDEARLVSRIRHPNVGTVIELGEDRDVLYIVMDWVDGEPLQVVMREAKAQVPLALALRIVKQAAAGLHAAHELREEDGKPVGLVHRDVSPQNILVGYDGVVKVIDFGVAKAESNLQRTSVGQLKGKVPYMAPEQAVGDRVDRRTDVFALGVVLYQLVTGKLPFRSDDSADVVALVIRGSPAPPSTLREGLPLALDGVVLRCLDKDPAHRYPSAAALAAALAPFIPGAKPAASPPERHDPTPTPPPRPRSRLPAIAIAVVLGLVLAAAAVAVLRG
jgi:eukaryotic-like serine/threonine-protein kinase